MKGKFKMNTYLGIELGSTRIKAVAIDETYNCVSSGDYTWQADFVNGIWTYDLDKVWQGLKDALKNAQNLQDIKAVGISGMMHGYLAFDEAWNLLVPFRTWQNTITAQAAAELTELFDFNIPQRWSIAHLYQAVLNGEEHVNRIAHITTLAGYVHFMLTGVNAIGVGEASGMFPIDSDKCCYNEEMIQKLEERLTDKNISWKLSDVLPSVLKAGENAGMLTEAGAARIGYLLPMGLPFAPPEGDAGTGMVATGAVAPRTGNVSAGTSIFSMVVLEKPLKKVYEEIDIVTTPAGRPVAMVHCNNCTTDSNAWVAMFRQVAQLFGANPSTSELYTRLYEVSLEGDSDCGGVLVCNYMAGEGITHLDAGRPMVVRRPESKFTLANFFKASLYATLATLRIGMDILQNENVVIDSMIGHGGLFKTPGVGQRYMATACDAPVTCMETAGEGGPYGMALLAAFSVARKEGEMLEDYLSQRVFKTSKSITVTPKQEDVDGFLAYMTQYEYLLEVERTAVDVL